MRHKSVNTPLSHERLVGGLQDAGRGTHVTHFVQLYPQPLYIASQVRTTCRSWDEGVLTDVCLTGVLTDLCLTPYIPFFIHNKLHWHTYRLLRGLIFSENLPKIPLFGTSLIYQLRLIGSQQHPQCGVLLTSFSTWGTENSLAEINLESTGGMIKGCNIILNQKLRNTCSFVGGRITVQQEKISRAERIWTNPLNALQEAIHYSFIKFCIYCSSVLYEFFVHYALRVERIIIMFLMRDLWNFSFFGRGDVSPTHSEFCRFVSGSKVKHQVATSSGSSTGRLYL